MENQLPKLTENEKIIKAHADELWAKAFTAIQFLNFTSLTKYEECQYNISILICNEMMLQAGENKQLYVIYEAVKKYLIKNKKQ